MNKEYIAGCYNFNQNGYIYLSVKENMEFGSAGTTYVHELYHARLTDMTLLGTLLRLIGLAKMFEESELYDILDDYGRVVAESSRKVQEIYACSMTWLWLLEKELLSEQEILLKHETDEYRAYREYFNRLYDCKTKSYSEKMDIIDSICRYALNATITSPEFLDVLEKEDPEELMSYLSKTVRYDDRLDEASEKYFSEGILLRENSDFIEENLTLLRLKIFKSISSFGEIITDFFKEGRLSDNIINEYNNIITKRTKVFDFSHIKVLRNVENGFTPDSCCVIKNCGEILDKKHNFYLIFHATSGESSLYYGKVKPNIQEILSDQQFVIIPFAEYDHQNKKPEYFDTELPVVVLIDDYDSCYKFAKEIMDSEEVYWGDIYRPEVNNFFTVIFFSVRGVPNIIFAFPTTKLLSEQLLKELEIESQITYTDEPWFFRIFGCFHDCASILKAYGSVMAFVLNSSASFAADTIVQKMSLDTVNTLVNSVMDLSKPHDYFNQMMRFPTANTRGNGKVWLLIQLENLTNLGVIALGGPNGSNPLLFDSKIAAERYAKSISDISYTAVQLDKVYWEYLKPKLRCANLVPVYCHGAIGKIVQLDEIDYLLT